MEQIKGQITFMLRATNGGFVLAGQYGEPIRIIPASQTAQVVELLRFWMNNVHQANNLEATINPIPIPLIADQSPARPIDGGVA